MFYSHEILTSREHGVATIWLVATLGSKSTTSKVNRKAILEVDVPKACRTITHPEAPMALRLQGNLLYGVSKVYSQQCGYALLEAQSVKDRMYTMLKTLQNAGLDPEAGKARRDQLILPNDPSFLPESMLPGLNFDLSALEFPSNLETPRKSSLLSSYIPGSSNDRAGEGRLRLNISSSDIGGRAFGVPPSAISSPTKDPEVDLPAFAGEEGGILLNPDFEFDEEGNIVELPVRGPRQDTRVDTVAASEPMGGMRVMDSVDGNVFGGGDQIPALGEDIEMRDREEYGVPIEDGYNDIEREEVVDMDREQTPLQTSTVQMRQRRSINKAMEVDDPPHLRNADLAQWNSGYVHNMAVAAKLKQNNKMITVAKKNAAFWVFGIGIASVGAGIGAYGIPHPLEVFSGDDLLQALTGKPSKSPRRKRGRSQVDADAEEGRNVRQKTDEEVGRGVGGDMDDDPGFFFDDIEVGREAAPALHDDHSSHMPWNVTGSVLSSRQGSALRPGTGLAGPYSSVRGPRSIASDGLPTSAGVGMGSRRGRLVSASPLAGRGAIRGASDVIGGIGLDADHEMDLDSLNGIGLGHYDSEDDLGHRTALGDAQSPTKWRSENLGQESINFLAFVSERVAEEGVQGRTTFSSLFPLESTSPVVATQAFLNILILATNGALRVKQKNAAHSIGAEGAGEIIIALSG